MVDAFMWLIITLSITPTKGLLPFLPPPSCWPTSLAFDHPSRLAREQLLLAARFAQIGEIPRRASRQVGGRIGKEAEGIHPKCFQLYTSS